MQRSNGAISKFGAYERQSRLAVFGGDPELPPRGPEGSILSPERAPEKRPASSGNKMGGTASMPSQY